MTILSITTADYTSYKSGTLSGFLRSCENAQLDVFLVLRDFDTIPDLDTPLLVHKLFVPQMSLSDARNAALQYIFDSNFDLSNYSLITFLDDDCEVTSSLTLLENPSLETDVFVGSYGPSLDERSNRFSSKSKKSESMGRTINRVASCTLYFKPVVIQSLGFFYPGLGVPNHPFSRGEDTEYFLRATEKGFSFSVIPSIFVKHPYKSVKREDTILSDLLISLRYFSKLGLTRVFRLSIKALIFVLAKKIDTQDFLKVLPESKALKMYSLRKRK